MGSVMKKLNIFGCPGTGKTTYLMRLLEDELQSVPAAQIAFVSFTRKGAYEGAERAKAKFKLTKPELAHFRTIHSLCFNALGMSRMDMIDKKHYKLLSQITGIAFTGYYTEDFNSSNDVYLHAAAMERHNPRLANKIISQLNAQRYEYIKFQYAAMKQQLGIVDFDDLLTMYLEKGKPLPVKVAFIDEAQDLTPLQWKVAMKMFSKVSRIYVAGDDDQAVYEWSGADVNGFLNFSRDSIVLDKSYRMPEKIWKLSKRITRDISNRKKKVFKSNGEKGSIEIAGSIRNVAFEGGALVLARTNWILRQLSFDAINRGLLFKFKGKLSADKLVVSALKNKTPLPKKLDTHALAYYERLLANGGLEKEPVLFETFHSSKGSENEHVIVSCDISARIQENFYNDRDSELRCLYVGLTRSKNKLTLLQPTGKEHYPEKYFA